MGYPVSVVLAGGWVCMYKTNYAVSDIHIWILPPRASSMNKVTEPSCDKESAGVWLVKRLLAFIIAL